MSEHDLGQSAANILWLDQPAEAFSGSSKRHFNSVRDAIHFIMRQLPLDERATSWIETETATIFYEAIALTEAALALLQQAEQDGGRLEVAEIVPAAHDALAACLERDWLQRHQDRTQHRQVWYTIPQAGQVLVGDPILRPIAHLERLLRDYRECHDPINRTAQVV